MFVLDNLLFMVETCYITYECSQMSLSDPCELGIIEKI